jgi:hypothetical protein
MTPVRAAPSLAAIEKEKRLIWAALSG